MRQQQRSQTAEVVATVRAGHLAFDDPPWVFEDPFAGDFIISPFWRLLVKNRLINQLSRKLVYRGMEPFFSLFLRRARWTEELLDKAVAAGTGQYVILGAGLDSFSWRRKDLAAALKVYEVDHPATQEAKRKRLLKLKLETPENHEFAPCDFENEGMADALARSSFSPERPAFFSWMGTTPYLSREAVLQTIGAVAALAAPGSEVVFDYSVPDQFHDPVDRRLIQYWRRKVSSWGEPPISSFDPRTFSSEVDEFGFDLVDNLSPTELDDLYLAGRPDLRTISLAYLAHLRLR
jgi:methyltransferase (TIGR00027 family)